MYAPQRFLIENYLQDATLTVSRHVPGIVSGAQKTGSGMAQLIAFGQYAGQQDLVVFVQMNNLDAGHAIGQARFRWRTSAMPNGVWGGTNVLTADAAIALSDGMFVRFIASAAPHFALNDTWMFRAISAWGPDRMLDADPDTFFRFDDKRNPLVITADLGAARRCRACYAAHTGSGDAVIALEAAASADFSSLLFQRVWQPPTNPLLHYFEQTARYWRLTIRDANNPDPELLIQHLFLGDYIELDESADWNAADTQGWFLREETTPAGRSQHSIYSSQRRLHLVYDGCSNADADRLHHLDVRLRQKTTGRNAPFFMHLFSDEADIFPARLSGELQRVYLGVDLNQCALDLLEVPQTIPPLPDYTAQITLPSDDIAIMQETLAQAEHDFQVGEMLAYFGSRYVRARANAAHTATALGVVTRVSGATFDLRYGGWLAGSNWTPGRWLYLNDVTPGGVTDRVPNWTFAVPIGYAVSATLAWIAPDRWTLAAASAIASVAETLTQAGHDFQAGELLRFDGAAYVRAQADDLAHADPLGMVSAVNGDAFVLLYAGNIAVSSANWTPGGIYALSELTSGAVTALYPIHGAFRPVLQAISMTTARLISARPLPVSFPVAVIESIAETLTQAGHDFQAGDVLRHDGAAYVRALADTPERAESLGVVSAVSGDTFVIVYAGKIAVTGANWTPGSVYWLDEIYAGCINLIAPSGAVRKPILLALTAATGVVVQSRGDW